MAAPASADPTNCAADDPRCSARAYRGPGSRMQCPTSSGCSTSTSRTAPTSRSRTTCADARRSNDPGGARAAAAPQLRTRIVESERETLARITEKSVQCEESSRSQQAGCRTTCRARGSGLARDADPRRSCWRRHLRLRWRPAVRTSRQSRRTTPPWSCHPRRKLRQPSRSRSRPCPAVDGVARGDQGRRDGSPDGRVARAADFRVSLTVTRVDAKADAVAA
jgi:hypothetical protein